MHVEHGVHQLRAHIVKALVAQDACVVNHDVDSAKVLYRRLHDRRAALWRGHAVRVGDCLAAESLDFVDYLLRRADIAAAAV